MVAKKTNAPMAKHHDALISVAMARALKEQIEAYLVRRQGEEPHRVVRRNEVMNELLAAGLSTKRHPQHEHEHEHERDNDIDRK